MQQVIPDFLYEKIPHELAQRPHTGAVLVSEKNYFLLLNVIQVGSDVRDEDYGIVKPPVPNVKSELPPSPEQKAIVAVFKVTSILYLCRSCFTF